MAVELEFGKPNWATAVTATAVMLGIAATMHAASWVGRERARQSVECVKVGGEWKETECVKGTR